MKQFETFPDRVEDVFEWLNYGSPEVLVEVAAGFGLVEEVGTFVIGGLGFTAALIVATAGATR